MITDEYSERSSLVLLFRTDSPEECEALHGFRAAFGGQSNIEAVTENLFALHIRRRVCWCGESEAA